MSEAPFKKHDLIEITHNGHTLNGCVLLASSNGKSLVIAFDAMITGHVGMMPLMVDGISGVSIIDGTEVILKKKDQPNADADL